jgi:threonine synthase
MKEALGIGRFADRLPDVGGKAFVTLGEGSTPVVRLGEIGRSIGLPNLYGKLEGSNPTGSYKDRIAAVSMTLALAEGKRGWIATSSGNGGSALSAYGNRAGLPGLLFVVPNIPREKLIPAQSLGTTIVSVEGRGTGGTPGAAKALFEIVRSAAAEHDLFLGVTAHSFNPEGMRGADTIAYELVEKGPAPDYCYVPTGGGGLASAIGRGFVECGAHTRLVAAQPSGCAPIARVLRGELEDPVVGRCDTTVSGLQLPLPPDGELAVATARKTGGWGTLVSDEEIYAAQRELARIEGVFVEPACATTLAAAAHDRRECCLSEEDSVVLVLTATGLKDLSSAERRLEPPAHIRTEGAPDAIARWVEKLTKRGAST